MIRALAAPGRRYAGFAAVRRGRVVFAEAGIARACGGGAGSCLPAAAGPAADLAAGPVADLGAGPAADRRPQTPSRSR